MHIHDDGEEQAFYILDSELVVHVGEDRLTPGPGAFVLVPRGLPHTLQAAGDVRRRPVPSSAERYRHYWRSWFK